MTILWIYDKAICPEAGGTERITSLIHDGLNQIGYKCMSIMIFHHNNNVITYNNELISNLYAFLKQHKVDIIINQIAYSTWLLEKFLNLGGKKWQKEGGKIISCLHFDPKNPSELRMLFQKPHKSFKDIIKILKFILFSSHYSKKKMEEEGKIYNFIYDHSDKMVLLSNSHKPYLEDVMKRHECPKFHIIHNPLTFKYILSADQLEAKKNAILVVGRLSEYHKRISLSLKAWKNIVKHDCAKYWTLNIVGDGSEKVVYEAFVKKHKLPRIIFWGQQNPERFYREAKILLVTSSAEGWGLNITEALQNGVVPVIMNTSVVFNDIIHNNKSGVLTHPNSVRHLSESILNLLENPEKLKSIQVEALKEAKRFSLNKTIDKWNDMICTLV